MRSQMRRFEKEARPVKAMLSRELVLDALPAAVRSRQPP